MLASFFIRLHVRVGLSYVSSFALHSLRHTCIHSPLITHYLLLSCRDTSYRQQQQSKQSKRASEGVKNNHYRLLSSDQSSAHNDPPDDRLVESQRHLLNEWRAALWKDSPSTYVCFDTSLSINESFIEPVQQIVREKKRKWTHEDSACFNSSDSSDGFETL